MKHSLITFALSVSQERQAEAERMLRRQREFKERKKEMQKADRLEAATKEYAKALTFIDLYHSPFCWKTVKVAEDQFEKTGDLSQTAKEDVVKEQIRIRVLGFGWSDLHCKWSDKTADELFEHLIKKIIPEEQKRCIPQKPKAILPSRGLRETHKLGTLTADVIELNKNEEKCKKDVVKAATEFRDKEIKEGKVDMTVQGQPTSAPKIDKTILDKRIQQLFEFPEKEKADRKVWCKGLVVGVKKGNIVRIQWDKKYLRPGDLEITEETLITERFNKKYLYSWRLDINNNI